MGGDEVDAGSGGADGVEPPEPRRRATFVPPARPDSPPESSDAAPNLAVRDEIARNGACRDSAHDDLSAAETHDDDELAGALEHEVSLLTATLPVIRPGSLFGPVRAPEPPYTPRTQAEREIAARVEAGDTLAAIEQLEALIAGRAAADSVTSRGAPDGSGMIHGPGSGDGIARSFAVADSPVTGASADVREPAEATSAPGADDLPSHAVPEALDADVGDDADDIDAGGPGLRPIATPRVRPHEDVLSAGNTQPTPYFAIEQSGGEPTPLEYRADRATRTFWVWFGVEPAVIVFALGALMVAAGLNLVQVTAGTVIGVALSFVPLGLRSLTGRWSGQPIVVVSRATFGVAGSTIAAILILVIRLFWAVALSWLLSVTVAQIAVTAGWSTDRGLVQWVSLGVAVMVSVAISLAGHAIVATVQVIATVVTAAVALAVVVAMWPAGGWQHLGSAPYGDWLVVVEGAVLVFSILGVAWAAAGGNLARYQRAGSGGTAAAVWGGLGASLPVLVLTVSGAAVALALPGRVQDLRTDPIRMIAAAAPHWSLIAVVAAIATGFVAALVVCLHSGGFAVQAMGVHPPRWASVLLLGALVAAGGAGLLVASPGIDGFLLSYPMALAVPVAASIGIVLGDFLLRRRRLDTGSLIRRGGVYPDWRWVNVSGLVLVTAVGLGLMQADAPWLRWDGYLYRLAGVDMHGTLAGSGLGVPVALVLGLAVGLCAGRRAVPAQESASR